jgi:NADH-quinone oxidoreductase subunit M
VVAAFGVILAALYLLWAYQRVFHGDPDEENQKFAELMVREGLVLLPFLGLIVFMGVYPKPVLDRIEPSIDALITRVEENTDFVEPEPTIRIGEHGEEESDHGGEEPADEEEPTEEEGDG